ncbi:hypothetical protein FJT64_009432 [Amphibalanus amphitrite]|uniref:Uncharacterized protein n=1 Tax=Amphibalanus amphitrite TaxID=1232801 RepID=A0A6A4VM55_AMPAM|nr:hypothetical protein FJT64_009432 [Amphibalanus amphitrite]
MLRLGSAYEGTYISQFADFDAFLELGDSLLEGFELERHEDGHVAAHLLPNVSQGMLSEELQQLLTEDGYLDARRFKRWTLDGLARAVERAAAEFPELRVAVTERQNVVGAQLRSEDAVVRVDFSAMMRTPLGWRALRPAALRPCGVALRPRDRPALWHLFSRQDLKSPPPSDSSARWFAPDPLTVEQEVLEHLPPVRRATQLLKMVAAARRWDIRFSLQSVVLKRAVLKAFAALCDQSVDPSGDTYGVRHPSCDAYGVRHPSYDAYGTPLPVVPPAPDVSRQNKNKIVVLVRKHERNFDSDQIRMKIRRIKIHPRYNDRNSDNDIALLE